MQPTGAVLATVTNNSTFLDQTFKNITLVFGAETSFQPPGNYTILVELNQSDIIIARANTPVWTTQRFTYAARIYYQSSYLVSANTLVYPFRMTAIVDPPPPPPPSPSPPPPSPPPR